MGCVILCCMGRFRKKKTHWATAQYCHPRKESDYPVSSTYIAAGLPLWVVLALGVLLGWAYSYVNFSIILPLNCLASMLVEGTCPSNNFARNKLFLKLRYVPSFAYAKL